MSKKSRVGQFGPTHYRTFTVFSSDVDLTTVTGCPRQEAERIDVHNDETTTEDIVVRGPDGVNVAFEVPADSIRTINAPVSAIESTATGTIASVTAYWWFDGTGSLNP